MSRMTSSSSATTNSTNYRPLSPKQKHHHQRAAQQQQDHQQQASSCKTLTNFSIESLIGLAGDVSRATSDESDHKTDPKITPETTKISSAINSAPVKDESGNKLSTTIKQHFYQSSPSSNTTTRKFRPKNFQCPACKMAFSNNGQLKNHVRIHTGERPFRCNQPGCGRTFTRNEELTRHKLIHTGARPHSCTVCGKRFGRKDHLKKHVRTHERKRPRKRVFMAPNATFLLSQPAQSQPQEQQQQQHNAGVGLFVSPNSTCASKVGIASQRISKNDKHSDDLIKQFLTNDKFTMPSISLPMSLASTPPITTTAAPSSFQHSHPIIATNTFPPLLPQATGQHVPVTTIGPCLPTPRPVNNQHTNALQQLASNYWSKWYDLFGFYQQQQNSQNPIPTLSSLFRKN